MLAAAFVAAASTSAAPGGSTRPLALTRAGPPGVRTSTLSQAGLRRLERRRWLSGSYVTSTGESVKVSISPAYASDVQAGQRWAEFFASLLHDEELARLDAYIAPLEEVELICNGEALGCYGGNHLVSMGETNFGVTPQAVATHEYGHHIAANRVSPPWPAIHWGTKRWASVVGVCARAAAGTAFPGAEDDNYSLNPGEAFAESYRVLIETKGTAVGYDWPIVDPSFNPTPASLAALREDVLHPWLLPTTKTIRGTFLRRRRIWSTQVATPLDGDIRVRVTVPGGGADDVTLLTGDGRTELATGTWTSSGGRSAEYRVCGARSVRVRVTRRAAVARFTLQMQVP